METRSVNQIKIFSLHLNDMRSSKIEILNTVAVACSEQRLRDFMEEHLAEEPYRDEHWSKVFKKGSPLEWYNKPWSGDRAVVDGWIEEYELQSYLSMKPSVVNLMTDEPS